jgi:exopolysaccharide biosynthesis WecB/TagA/CpsF family protein
MTVSDIVRRPDHVKGSPYQRPRHQLPLTWPNAQLAGVPTDLLELDDALGVIINHAEQRDGDVLGVVSINLDHLYHFGSGRTSARVEREAVLNLSMNGRARWLALLDGAPLAKRAGDLTGRPWPRLAGSDLIEPILDEAQRRGLRIAFLGGATATHEALKPIMKRRWPELAVAGYWSPSRSELDDSTNAAALAAEIRQGDVDILAVCLGKPRQERWIAEHGAASGAAVCLAFGAVVDFLAGRVDRAPRWIADHGLEWAWRLSNEPRRLARRYLVQGPRAYVALQRDSFVFEPTTYFSEPRPLVSATTHEPPRLKFADSLDHADVGVVIVGSNARCDLLPQLQSLRRELHHQTIRVVVVNVAGAGEHPRTIAPDDVVSVRAQATVSIGEQINLGRAAIGLVDAVLILGDGLQVEAGALRALRQRLLHTEVGGAIPRLVDNEGWVIPGINRADSTLRSAGDALFADRLRSRPAWLSSTVWSPRSYRYPHEVAGASNLALMVGRRADEIVGAWAALDGHQVVNDYIARMRAARAHVWFEPSATFRRAEKDSGPSDRPAK